MNGLLKRYCYELLRQLAMVAWPRYAPRSSWATSGRAVWLKRLGVCRRLDAHDDQLFTHNTQPLGYFFISSVGSWFKDY